MKKVELVTAAAGALTAIVGLGAAVWNIYAPKDPIVIELRPTPAEASLTPTVPDPSAQTDPAPQPELAPDLASDPAPQSVPAPLPPVPEPMSTPEPKTIAGWTPEKSLRVNERSAVTVCPDGQRLAFSVAKQGTRADSGIYLTSPRASGRIDVGSEIELSESCRLFLDRTGKAGSYFAEFTFSGTISE